MSADRSLLLTSILLQGTVALSFGLALLGLWRAFRRPSALRFAIAWLVYAFGTVVPAFARLANLQSSSTASLLLGLPLLSAVVLFSAGTDAIGREAVGRGLRPYVAACGLMAAGLLVAVLGLAPLVDADLPERLTFVAPRLIMAAAFARAAWPLRRTLAQDSHHGHRALAGVLTLLSVRAAASAAYEAWQVSRGRTPESVVLTMIQVALLVAFGVATAVVLIEVERVRAVRAAEVIQKAAEALRASEAAQRRLEREVFQRSRLDSLGQMAGTVAHDFNNMLAGILAALEHVRDLVAPGSPAGRYFDLIETVVGRGSALTRQLLAFARQAPQASVLFCVRDRIAALDGMLRVTAGRGVILVIDGDVAPLRVRADPGQFDQAIVNLTINARDAMPNGGTLTIRSHAVQVPAPGGSAEGEGTGTMVRVEVEDTGTGIPEDMRERIFEPFFTTKGEGGGTGLGLASAYGFARQAGGSLTVESAQGSGARFILDLPLGTA